MEFILNKMLEDFNFDCLIPNGFLLPVKCKSSATLSDLKTLLWKEVQTLPAIDILKRADAYIFQGVTEEGIEEFQNDVKVSELKLFTPLLVLTEPKEQKDAAKLRHDIGEAMGISVNSLDTIPDEEIQTFRRSICNHCVDVVRQRQSVDRQNLVLYHFPPILDLNPDLPMYIVKQLKKYNYHFKVNVWRDQEGERTVTPVQACLTDIPSKIVQKAIFEIYKKNYDEEQLRSMAERGSEDYTLKICGREEYLLKQCDIHQYKYIRDCISQGREPQLMFFLKEELYRCIPKEQPSNSRNSKEQVRPAIKHQKYVSSWDISSKRYTVKINSIKGGHSLLSATECRMFVEACLYHGADRLCKPFSTFRLGWHQPFTFDIYIQDLPRSAKLCLTLCTFPAGTKKNLQATAYGTHWVNLQVFDENGRLRVGRTELSVWPLPQGNSDKAYPIGVSGSNPDFNAPVLEIDIVDPCTDKETVTFPTQDEIDNKISELNAKNEMVIYSRDEIDSKISDLIARRKTVQNHVNKDEIDRKVSELMARRKMASIVETRECGEKLDHLLSKDFLSTLTQADCDFLWKNRYQCLAKPHSLPKLLKAVRWSNREQVFQMYSLLKEWPVDDIYQVTTLQLLDGQYPDLRVREFAVQCLERHFTDQHILLYLLQLTQVLKFDCYVDSPLCRYLLKKALTNKLIGQKLFWNLRSELHNKTSRWRFAPILEAYCKYCGPMLPVHLKEVVALETCYELSSIVKKATDEVNSVQAQKLLLEKLQTDECTEKLSNIGSVMDLADQLGQICPDKCKVLDSKMRPLWLEWKNPDKLADEEELGISKSKQIYKNGDDLRQDMLCLQLLTVMDMVWKYAGMDLRLATYNCVSLGDGVGLIDVVREAHTVANIQGQAKRSSFINSTLVHGWLHEKNQHRYMDMVKTFKLSCAGYGVATYILGIRDRHSDNIMIKENGQVFHIDFGHFLDNRKQKFGISRERVPFVLTEDFIKVITFGVPNPSTSKQFNDFVTVCLEAFIALRQNADLLITLLSLMLHSNLPELQEKGIQYVRSSLGLDGSEVEAARNFLKQLLKAYSDQWTVQVDWIFHRLKHKS